MASILKDEYERCKTCNCPDFIEHTTYSFSNLIKAREGNQLDKPLQAMEKSIVYRCIKCGDQLKK